MSESISRRDALVKLALLAGGSSALGAGTARAAEQPHLMPSDPTAVALGYHENAAAVEPKQFGNYKAGESCSNCLQLQGETGTWRPCNLFPGKLVNAGGWCRVWIKRP